MLIRAAGESDLDAACRLLEAAFRRPDEARLVRGMRGSDDLAVALVALDGGADGGTDGGPDGGADAGPDGGGTEGGDRVAGVAVLSHLLAPEGCLALGPLAVARERRDRGIGKALIAESVGWARRAGHGAVFVLGQPPYYERFGFSVEAARAFRSPYPADYMMALELRPGALRDALAGGGEIRYPPAFAALG